MHIRAAGVFKTAFFSCARCSSSWNQTIMQAFVNETTGCSAVKLSFQPTNEVERVGSHYHFLASIRINNCFYTNRKQVFGEENYSKKF